MKLPPASVPVLGELPPRVRQALRVLVPQSEPIYVSVQLPVQSQPCDCHKNVARQIADHGGSALSGWVIYMVPPWEWHVEFHTVWSCPNRGLIDVTEPLTVVPYATKEVLFLPDPTRPYQGLNIPTQHLPWDDTPSCAEFIEVITAIDALYSPPGVSPIPPPQDSDLLRELSARYRWLVHGDLISGDISASAGISEGSDS